MKVFTCTDHAAHFVGGASVIVAKDRRQARALLHKALNEYGLTTDGTETLDELDTNSPHAEVLHDGDY